MHERIDGLRIARFQICRTCLTTGFRQGQVAEIFKIEQSRRLIVVIESRNGDPGFGYSIRKYRRLEASPANGASVLNCP